MLLNSKGLVALSPFSNIFKRNAVKVWWHKRKGGNKTIRNTNEVTKNIINIKYTAIYLHIHPQYINTYVIINT